MIKRKKKIDILKSVSEGLNEGQSNKGISYLKKLIKKSQEVKLNEDNFVSYEEKQKASELLTIMHRLEKKFDESDAQKLKKVKMRSFSKMKWYRKFWNKVKIKHYKFKISMKEKWNNIWSFCKHEFLTLRKLIFFIHDQFFGAEYKNRKLFYLYKKKYINANGYAKGEKEFNNMIRNLTKGVELNKKLMETHG